MSQTNSIKVNVKLYASLTKYAGGSIMHDPIQVEVPESATLENLYDTLGIPQEEVKTAFVNSTIQTSDYILHDGDEVGIFPPVGGGRSSAEERSDGESSRPSRFSFPIRFFAGSSRVKLKGQE